MSVKIQAQVQKFNIEELKYLIEHIYGRYSQNGAMLLNGVLSLKYCERRTLTKRKQPKYYLVYKTEHLSGLFLETITPSFDNDGDELEFWVYAFNFPLPWRNRPFRAYLYIAFKVDETRVVNPNDEGRSLLNNYSAGIWIKDKPNYEMVVEGDSYNWVC